jgi:hypothetical protein
VWVGSGLEGVALLWVIVAAIAFTFYIEHRRIEPT